MTADSAINEHSQQSPITTPATTSVGGSISSVLSRGQSMSSPWASVVRGDSEPISSPTAVADIPRFSLSLTTTIAEQTSAFQKTPMGNSGPETQSESSDTNKDGNVGNLKRPAWNKSLNGVVDLGSVMGAAVSWPALSESTRLASRSSDSPRPFPDGSSSSCQGSEISEPPQREANTHAHNNFSAKQTMPIRQRPVRHRGGGGGISPRNGPSQSGFTRPSLPVVPPFVPPYPTFDISYGAVVPAVMDTSVRGMRSMAGVGGSQSHTSNDPYLHRNNSKRGTFGPHPRGDGTHNHHHAGRQDQDRRDVHLPRQYIPPSIGFMPSPPSPGSAQFITHPPMRAFAGSVGFDMAPPAVYVPTLPPETFRPMPLVPPPPPPPPLSPMLFPAIIDAPLPTLIVKQIDYYFSDANLVKDIFLRERMDAEGWVPISLIATFPRVQMLTANIQMILDSLRSSIIVEVQDNKIRKRNEWMKWIQTSNPYNADSGSQSPGASAEKFLVESFQNVSVDDALTNATSDTTDDQMEKDQARCLSEDVIGQSKLANGEDTEAHSLHK